MKVSTEKPFKVGYNLYQHEYLGYLFEASVIQTDDTGKLTLLNQGISSANAKEYSKGLDEIDFELIKLIDSIHVDSIIKKFYTKRVTATQFFLSVFDKEKGESVIQGAIKQYLEARRAEILSRLKGKLLFEMGNDGKPILHKQITVEETPATVLFHIKQNEDGGLHYFPTVKHNNQKLEFMQQNAIILCYEPAWLLVKQHLYYFNNDVDGKKFQPFLNKKFTVIQADKKEEFFSKFLTNLLEQYDVRADGINIYKVTEQPVVQLQMTELPRVKSLTLFGESTPEIGVVDEDRIVFDICFSYDRFQIQAGGSNPCTVKLEVNEHQNGKDYAFYKIYRQIPFEQEVIAALRKSGLEAKAGKATLPKSVAFSWLSENRELINKYNIKTIQTTNKSGKVYFLGEQYINFEIQENKDWFDITAVVRFGEYTIPFVKLRKLILANQREFELPNGQIAVIPDSWFVKYADLFHFAEEKGNGQVIEKHHLNLIYELRASNLATVMMSRKLEALRNFEQIEEYALPKDFKGQLRPYQQAGYNWLCFLDEYNFGGCLADDMGLGKTVQTLAMLQRQKELNSKAGFPSLLVMPTSLLYNWEMEAKKFTPYMKVLNYTGSNRQKWLKVFNEYDLVITSYGIIRLDAEILKEFHFNYVILDESQAIKNPASNITKAVSMLKARRRLVVTGTPIENSTLDLWSQMSFVNPGLLGNQNYFKKEYLNAIEKKSNEEKNQKLHAIIKPFVMRRHKSQVATELPEKTEYIQYCDMTETQEKEYDETKNYFRNLILEAIDDKGVGKSSIMILRGLTLLRQLANHPKMVKPEYEGNSGKMEDVIYKLRNAVDMGHKILIFSQFVKHLQILKDYLQHEKIKFAYLDGNTRDRQAEVNKFQNSSQIPAFLISLKAGGVGLNLTAADYVFILDPWWNPAVEAQAIDRAHRIGQQNKVIIYKFITRNSVEEKILELQKSKLQLAGNLIKVEDSFMKNLTKDDIRTLLE